MCLFIQRQMIGIRGRITERWKRGFCDDRGEWISRARREVLWGGKREKRKARRGRRRFISNYSISLLVTSSFFLLFFPSPILSFPCILSYLPSLDSKDAKIYYTLLILSITVENGRFFVKTLTIQKTRKKLFLFFSVSFIDLSRILYTIKWDTMDT